MKNFLVSILLLDSFSFCFAQEKGCTIGFGFNRYSSKLSFAPESHVSSVTGTSDEIKYLNSFSFDIFLQKDISKRFSLGTKISFEDKGALRYYQPYNSAIRHSYTPVATFNLNYLNIPILVRAHLGKKVPFFLEVGPYVGFLFKSRVNFHELNKWELGFYNNIKYFKTVDAGISVGAGISYPFHKFIASLEYMMSWGAINILRPQYLAYYPTYYLDESFSGTEGFKQAYTYAQKISFSIGYKLGKRQAKSEDDKLKDEQNKSIKYVLRIEGGLTSSYYYYYTPQKNYGSGEYKNINPLSGFSFGVTRHRYFVTRFSLRPSLTYSRTGFFYYTTIYGANAQTDVRIDQYLDYLIFAFPVQIETGKKIKCFLNVGPYLGTLVHRFDVLSRKNYTQSSSRIGVGIYDLFDLGLTSGLGVTFQVLKKGALTFEVKNNFGLSNIYNALYNDDGDILRTRSLNFLLGYSFLIKGKNK